MQLPRLAVLADLREEQWPSMDLVADMLLAHLQRDHATTIAATGLYPSLRRRFTNPPWQGLVNGRGFNADRVLNRFWDYPRALAASRAAFDLFHIVDHSYGQLVHQLPAQRTIVTCHDLDTFRCLLDPAAEPRSRPFKMLVGRTLAGFRQAALVVCDCTTVRDQLLAHGLFPPERLRVAPLGVHPSCQAEPEPVADREAARLLAAVPPDAPCLLHVGSTIPRKRIDVLLRVFAAIRQRCSQAWLLRAGGPFTPAQTDLLSEFNLTESVVVLPFLRREVLAAVYRRAALVLQPSAAEGFGLPVAEALACGTPVVASDLAVLKEVGGEVASYLPVGDVPAWSETVVQLLTERSAQPDRWQQRRAAARRQAARFSWAEYARQMVSIYQELMR